MVRNAHFHVSTLTVSAAGAPNSTWFNSYHAYADHLQYLNDLASTYSKNAKVVTSGNSLQGNPITGLHIFGSSGGGKKPAVVLHGTVHAREWIASMVRLTLSPSLRSDLSHLHAHASRLSNTLSTSSSASTAPTRRLPRLLTSTTFTCSPLST